MKSRLVGLHLRIYSGLIEVAQEALNLGLNTFQCFLIDQENKRYIAPTTQEVKEFRALREHYFPQLFVHASYWVNISSKQHKTGMNVLKRELRLAQKLSFTHMILHPGSATGWQDRMEGIDTLVRNLNTICAELQDITLILENVAHGGQTIGNDLNDFLLIRQKLEYPEKVGFCIDTAHAFAYGYDIKDPKGQEQFVSLIDKTIGPENLLLIHLNDTQEPFASKIDRHTTWDKGHIGAEALRQLLQHSIFSSVPIILELPPVDSSVALQEVKQVLSW